MKNLILLGYLSLIAITGVTAQTADEEAVKKVIVAFSEAGDKNNVEVLEKCLDDNYRVVMNQLFGSKEVTTIPKEVYLEKIRTKEFGGDTRKVTIEQVTLNGSTAMAKVIFQGSKLTFNSLIVLLKDEKNTWKLLSDIPIIR